MNAQSETDPTSGDPVKFAALFRDFAEPVPAIMQRVLEGAAAPYFAPIEEVVQTPWVQGRIILIGDAAHATSPNMAEGAGLAIEDALVLADMIASNRSLEDFETRRKPRVEHVQVQTHRRDRTRNLPSLVRKTTLRIAGKRIFRDNYEPLLPRP